MKKSHRAKRERDRKKRDEKLLKCVDGAVFTKHAIARANERSVSKNDIKQALQYGKVKQTSAKTFRVSSKGVAVIVAKVPTKRLEEGTPSHLAVVTTWKGSRKKKKLKKTKKKKYKSSKSLLK